MNVVSPFLCVGGAGGPGSRIWYWDARDASSSGGLMTTWTDQRRGLTFNINTAPAITGSPQYLSCTSGSKGFYAAAPATDIIALGTARTVGMRIFLKGTLAGGDDISFGGADSLSGVLELVGAEVFTSVSGTVYGRRTVENTTVSSTASFTKNAWHTIVVTADASRNTEIFWDNVSLATGTFTGTNTDLQSHSHWRGTMTGNDSRIGFIAVADYVVSSGTRGTWHTDWSAVYP